jgi:hypothetical protein
MLPSVQVLVNFSKTSGKLRNVNYLKLGQKNKPTTILWHKHFPCYETHKRTEILWHSHFPCCDTHKPTAILWHSHFPFETHTKLEQFCVTTTFRVATHKPYRSFEAQALSVLSQTYKLIKKYGVSSTISFLGAPHWRFNGNVLAFLSRILHGWSHLPMKTLGIRADPRSVGAPGKLIIRRPFEPISFNRLRPRTGLANISEGAFSNCG